MINGLGLNFVKTLFLINFNIRPKFRKINLINSKLRPKFRKNIFLINFNIRPKFRKNQL